MHSPSDSPGRFNHKNASITSLPVSVVGALPSLRPGGLHHSTPWGPAPLRLVSMTKCAPPSFSQRVALTPRLFPLSNTSESKMF